MSAASFPSGGANGHDMTAQHRRALLEVAAGAVHDALARRDANAALPDATAFDARLRDPGASFVTLERGEDLLGCIGTLEPVRPLVTDVAHNALAAAFADPRLPAVTPHDYERMSIKVSVLSRPEPVEAAGYHDLVAAVRPGVDGLLLEAGPRRSTLLPAVWPKVDDVHMFLDVLWRKAGLPPMLWPAGLRVSRYETDEFADPGPRPPVRR
jgi:AmmeMemoRadiSam system protein A